MLVVLAMGTSIDAAAKDSAAELYDAARTSYAELQDKPKKYRHHFQETIDRFRAVTEKHPTSRVADEAFYMMGKVYRELYEISRLRGDLEHSIEAYGDCAEKYPTSNYADDCLYLRAKAQLRIGKDAAAVDSLRKLVRDHPKGDMRRPAERLLAEKGVRVAAVTKTPAPTPTPTVVPAAKQKRTSGGRAAEESQQVTGVKHWSNDDYTQVAVYGGGPMAWSINELPPDGEKSRRIYLDLKKSHLGEGLKSTLDLDGTSYRVKIDDGLLTAARVAQFDPETVRVVLDVESIDDFTVIPLEDPFRVMIQVFGKKPPAATVAVAAPGPTSGLVIGLPTPAPTATPDPAAIAKELREAERRTGISLSEQLGLKVGRIYVDAGHGGHDPGARGPSGLREKDVTLRIAKKLEKKLDALGYDAILTRTDDTYLSLEERSGMANEGKGDLFVSIHCNSTEGNKSASGVETYFANTASDKASARLAAIENATTTQKMSELEQILEGLLRGAFTPMSADLAGSVQERLYREIHEVSPRSRNYGVKTALFYVLLTAQMPAILVETSFISNPKDEKRLKDDKYLDRVAVSIAQGVDAYLEARSLSRPIEVAKEDPKSASDEPESKTPSGGGGSAGKGKSPRTGATDP